MKGAVLSLAGQVSIAETLEEAGVTGSAYLRCMQEDTSRPLKFLPAKALAEAAA